MKTPNPIPEFRDHRPQVLWWAWAGAVLLLLFSVFSIWQSRHAQRQLAELQSRLDHQKVTHLNLEAEKALTERARAIAADPLSLQFTLRAKSAPALRGLWHAKLGILIYGVNVPIPGANGVFQLWLIPNEEKAEPLPASIFRPDAAGNVTLVIAVPPAPINSTAALAISEEPAAGSLQLASAPIWLGSIRK